MHITEIAYANSQYPKLLREMHSPPPVLYVAGTLRDVPLVAIVGTRKPTDYGKQITYKLASELASAGIGIVSGLAIGIDAMAHQAALEAGGYTIAVMGGGLGEIYPARNRDLGVKIMSSGSALITEYKSDQTPRKHHFPARNRIIAGLCLATIVTEADEGSGSLITAGFARDENRLVMAVPGAITSQRSFGPNSLIKSGAIPVTSAADVLDALDLKAEELIKPPPTPKTKDEATILDLITKGVNDSAGLISASGFSASHFAHVITMMEINGTVRNLGAGMWISR